MPVFQHVKVLWFCCIVHFIRMLIFFLSSYWDNNFEVESCRTTQIISVQPNFKTTWSHLFFSALSPTHLVPILFSSKLKKRLCVQYHILQSTETWREQSLCPLHKKHVLFMALSWKTLRELLTAIIPGSLAVPTAISTLWKQHCISHKNMERCAALDPHPTTQHSIVFESAVASNRQRNLKFRNLTVFYAYLPL